MSNALTAGLFSPVGANVTLTVGVASANVAANPPGQNGGIARLMNIGANVIHLAFGGAAVTASIPGSMAMGPNSLEHIDWPPGTTHVAAIAASAGNTLHIQAGIGI